METDCNFLSASSGGRELKSREMSKSAHLLCCGLSLVQTLAQHGGKDTGAGWKARIDGYLISFARVKLGRGETQNSVVCERLS